MLHLRRAAADPARDCGKHLGPMWPFKSTSREPQGPLRLHIGSGTESLAGWVNIDTRRLPGVDVVLDVRSGLPFSSVEAIYAEHFLEHLTLDEGLAFLAECRRALADAGVLRLSTPNLDWVHATHYHPGGWASESEALRDALYINRAFRGWGHRFLYNRAALSAVLASTGFGRLVFCRYGESGIAGLSGLERHETWQDTPELPHVLIVEASGRSAPAPLTSPDLEDYRRDVGVA
jgi:predicted SAM-dependent methyltransferase